MRILLEMGIFKVLLLNRTSLLIDVLVEKLKVEKDLLNKTFPFYNVYFI